MRATAAGARAAAAGACVIGAEAKAEVEGAHTKELMKTKLQASYFMPLHQFCRQMSTCMQTGLGVLAIERDSVSTYSRNYKHKRERLPCSNTRGGRPKHNGPTQGGKTRLCMRQARQARSDQPHASDPARIRAKHQTRSGTEPEKG